LTIRKSFFTLPILVIQRVHEYTLKSRSEISEKNKLYPSLQRPCSKMLIKHKNSSGFTFIEVLLIVAILATLLVVALPGFQRMIDRAKISQACADIAAMGNKISDHFMDHGQYPETLEELDHPKQYDPYGFAYEYLVIFGKNKSDIAGVWRKDRFLVPLNYDFDLYSVGKDGKSKAPLTAQSSYDDIIRANNGQFIDIASKY
jgi:general secretion pathway protein G